MSDGYEKMCERQLHEAVEYAARTTAARARQAGGDHYVKLKIQPIEYIQANGLGYHEGNVLKYITRWKDKDGIKDLRKAVHYLELLIEHTEKSEAVK
jgi:hypothetical protein